MSIAQLKESNEDDIRISSPLPSSSFLFAVREMKISTSPVTHEKVSDTTFSELMDIILYTLFLYNMFKSQLNLEPHLTLNSAALKWKSFSRNFPMPSRLAKFWLIRDDTHRRWRLGIELHSISFWVSVGLVPIHQKTVLVTVAHEGPRRVHCCISLYRQSTCPVRAWLTSGRCDHHQKRFSGHAGK